MSEGLSKRDVAALLSDVSAPESAAVRLGSKVAEGTLTPAERVAAEQVLRVMLDGAALKIRQILAETLKESPFMPHDVAMMLANDVDAVAVPVLQFSSVLTDEDLIEIVRAGSPGKQIAIAGRPAVSPAVAGELLDTGNSRAAVTLVGNPGATLNADHLEIAVNRYGSDPRMAESLQKRPDLPINVAERLVAFTVESLRAYISKRTDLSEPAITQLVLQTREQVTLDLRSAHFPAEEALSLVEHLAAVKRLTPSLILRALCVGDLSFFEAAMAQLAQVPVHNARLLIHDSGHLGLKSLYDRSKLPSSYYPAFKVAIDVAHETEFDGLPYDRERYRRTMIERILTQFEELGADDLDYLLVRLEDPAPQIETELQPG
ncbi:MAG TPA: DUF2336 domain-containing protein [Aliidongia sp.]|nr:DUF2336 domain-containing protein [Aliidongia sp.]